MKETTMLRIEDASGDGVGPTNDGSESDADAGVTTSVVSPVARASQHDQGPPTIDFVLPSSEPASGSSLPPPPPPMRADARQGWWRPALIGGVCGAVVAALVSGVIVAAADDDPTVVSAPAGETVGEPVRTGQPSPDDGAGAPRTPADPAPGAANGPTTNGPTSSDVAMDVKGVLAKVEPSVVAIELGALDATGRTFDVGAGSGVIISDDGLVLTNAHVVDGLVGTAGTATVRLNDGRELAAEFLGSEPTRDVALLRIRNAEDLVPITLGSSDALEVGDEVLAIGNALDLEGGLSVTRGIVSALERTLGGGQDPLEHLIQTDAAINPGNSGGALVNAAGELVGIPTAIIQDSQNIGFAIAIDSVKQLVETLKSNQGEVTSVAYLGVITTPVEDLTAAERDRYGVTAETGVFVSAVTPGTGASEVGLQAGDVIISVDGVAITDQDGLGRAIRSNEPGETVVVAWTRGSETMSGSATLGSAPER